MAPGKDVLVLFEKSHECSVDQRTGDGVDPSYLIWSGVIEKYLFKPFNELCHHSSLFYVHGL